MSDALVQLGLGLVRTLVIAALPPLLLAGFLLGLVCWWLARQAELARQEGAA